MNLQSPEARQLHLAAAAQKSGINFFLIANAFWEALTFELPKLDQPWVRVLDTVSPRLMTLLKIIKKSSFLSKLPAKFITALLCC